MPYTLDLDLGDAAVVLRKDHQPQLLVTDTTNTNANAILAAALIWAVNHQHPALTTILEDFNDFLT